MPHLSTYSQFLVLSAIILVPFLGNSVSFGKLVIIVLLPMYPAQLHWLPMCKLHCYHWYDFYTQYADIGIITTDAHCKQHNHWTSFYNINPSVDNITKLRFRLWIQVSLTNHDLHDEEYVMNWNTIKDMCLHIKVQKGLEQTRSLTVHGK